MSMHLAEAANWPAIQAHGLYPACELVARAGCGPLDRERLLNRQRPEHAILPDGVNLRDQGPMPPAGLARRLVGMTPAEWYALVNAHVFFWLDPDRLERQRRACAPRRQLALTIDAPGWRRPTPSMSD